MLFSVAVFTAVTTGMFVTALFVDTTAGVVPAMAQAWSSWSCVLAVLAKGQL